MKHVGAHQLPHAQAVVISQRLSTNHMHSNIYRSVSEFARSTVAPFFMCWVYSAQAQGQGSYGGMADGIVGLVLIAFFIGAALVLMAIRFVIGNKAALISLVALLVGLGYLIDQSHTKAAKREAAYKIIERSYAEGCAETSRHLERTARGDEQIFIRLQGAPLVPEHQRSELLPSQSRLPDGVKIVSDPPPGTANAIVIDIHYSRDLIPGSYPGYEWHRTRYALTAKTFPDEKLIARTNDVQARNGFCLGDLEAFLKQALNRSGVLHANESSHTTRVGVALPDAHVRGEYSEAASGVYLKSSTVRNEFDEIKKQMIAQGCNIKESKISPPIALCSSPSGPTEVPLDSVIGLHRLHDSWLLIYSVYKGGQALTSLRIEQRLADWRLARVWAANAVPPFGDSGGGKHLDEFAMDGEAITASAYWDWKSDFNGRPSSNWYTKRSTLRVPLPGVMR